MESSESNASLPIWLKIGGYFVLVYIVYQILDMLNIFGFFFNNVSSGSLNVRLGDSLLNNSVYYGTSETVAFWATVITSFIISGVLINLLKKWFKSPV